LSFLAFIHSKYAIIKFGNIYNPIEPCGYLFSLIFEKKVFFVFGI